MADVKISNLPAATTPLAGTEEIPLVQSGVTKKATVDDIVAAAATGVTSVTGTAPIVSSGGTTPAISITQASASTNGYLSSTDWNTFNNKQPAGSYLTSGGALGTPSSGTATNLTGLPLSTGVTGTLPVANGGTGTATPSLVAGTNVTISGTWPNQTINSTGGGGGSGTVTSVATGTGLSGGPITTSGTISLADTAVTPGTYTAANITVDAQGRITAAANGSGGGGGTVTSVGLTMPTGFSVSGSPITTSGTLAVTTTLSGMLKGTGSGIIAAVSGTDYAPATSGSSILYGNSAGGFSNVTVGSGLSFSTGTLSATGGTGTVTSVSGTGTVNGISLSGTVTSSGSLTLGGTLDLSSPPAIGGTTPAAITGTNITATGDFVGGHFKANSSAGGSLQSNSGSTCVSWGAGGGANVTLVAPALGTPASGNFSSGTFTWPTFNQNTTGTAAGLSATLAVGSGGTGAITLTGLLKGNGTSAFTAATAGTDYVAPGGALGTPSSGTLTNATGLPLTTGVTGTLPIANGGTNATSFTSPVSSVNGLVWFDGTRFVNDTSPAHVGYNASTNTFNALNLALGASYTETVYTANSSTAITLSVANGTVQIITLTGNCTYTFPSTVAGQSLTLLQLQDATGGRTVTWPSSVKWPSSTAPTITSTASKGDKFVFTCDGTYWWGSVAGQNYL